MDNKITKKRLNDMISYDWIIMLVVAVVCVIVWELIFSFASVKPTTGQTFMYMFDDGVAMQSGGIEKMISDGDLLSYDILKIETKEIDNSTGTDLLTAYLQNGECDVLFISKDAGYNEQKRLKHNVDYGYIYNFSDLLKDAKDYLDKFLTNGEIDETKVEEIFLQRMKKDNRFKSKTEKEQGVLLEIARIEKLKKDVCDFEKVLSCGQDIFYKYTRFEQLQEQEEDAEDKKVYEQLYNDEIGDGRRDAIYGINLGNLPITQGKKSVSEYVVIRGTSEATDIILTVGKFTKKQSDLQFETLSFVNEIVRDCTDILD